MRISVISLILALLQASFCATLWELPHRERVQYEFDILFNRAQGAGWLNSPMFIKSGTPLLLDIIRNRHLLTTEQQSILGEKLTRPTLPDYYDTPEGHFRIHYNAAISDTDYVYRCGEFFERAWAVEVDSLGFLQPVTDEGLGGNDRFDVYIMNLGPGLYGITIPDDIEGPNPWHDVSASIQVNTSYDGFPDNDDPEGSAWGAFKVTCAHEFFHAIQMAYDPDEQVWMLEIASVWMEDVVYDYVNDYYNYLSGYYQYIFEAPYLSLMEYSMHMYSSCVWFHYLSQRFGTNIINNIFYEMIYQNGMYAISAALDSIDTAEISIGDEFCQFACWNYLTGSRADEFHYEEASSYPEIATEATVSSYPYTFSPVSTHRPHSFGSNYIVLSGTPDSGVFIDIDGDTGAEWKIAVVIPTDSAEILLPDEYGYVNTRGLPAAVAVSAIGSFSTASTTYNYSITIRECTKICQTPEKPRFFALKCHPNPFNSFCKVSFFLNADCDVKIDVINLSGQKISTLHKGFLNAGEHNVEWKVHDEPSGIYFIRLKTEGQTITKRSVLIK